MLDVFRHDPATFAELDALLHAPSLYDEFLRHLARRGLPVPRERVERDCTQPYERNPGPRAGVQDDLRRSRGSGGTPTTCARSWSTSRKSFQLWRFRHMKTVERIIGHKTGTGGSSGVGFLQARARAPFFPELIDVRTVIGALSATVHAERCAPAATVAHRSRRRRAAAPDR